VASWFEAAGFGYQEFTAGRLRTFAIVEGRTESCPLILLHSVPGASFMWSTTIHSIGRARKIIAPDLPGWGRSRNRITSPIVVLTRESLRVWLEELTASQQCERCDIAGLGSGAWLALEYLRSNPARVRRLALVNLPFRMNTSRRWPWQKNDWNRARLATWYQQQSGLSNASPAKPLFDELLSGGWHAESSPELTSAEYLVQMQEYAKALRGFEGEVLLSWGKQSAGYDPQHAAEFAQGREIVLWNEAANFPMWEQPREFEAELAGIFQS